MNNNEENKVIEKEESIENSKKIDLYINNNESNDESGINIMNIFGYMKKRFHIFAFIILITFIIGLLVPFMMYSLKDKNEEAIAILGFDYEGAEDGLAPDGSSLDISYIKQSSFLIQNALSNVELSKNLTAALIQSNITITGVLTDETKQQQEIIDELKEAKSTDYAKLVQEFSPKYKAQYIITLKNGFKENENSKKINLPTKELSQLLSAILSAYADYFNETYRDLVLPSNQIDAIDTNSLDYLDILDEVYNYLTYLENYCLARKDYVSGYRASDGMSFSDLASIIHTVKSSDIDYIYSYIYLNNVSKDPALQITNYKYQKRQANLDLVEVNEAINTTKNSIDNYKTDKVVISSADNNQTTTVDVTSDYYNNLVLELNSLNEQKTALEERITILDKRIEMLEGTPATEAEVAKAESYINSALANANSIYNIVYDHSDELVSSNAYQNQYMHAIITSDADSIKDSMKLFLIGAGAGLFIGLAAWAVDAFILEIRDSQRRQKEALKDEK